MSDPRVTASGETAIDELPVVRQAVVWTVIIESLRIQFGTLKPAGRGQHRKYLPYVFTEQGVAMLSSVLNSKHAIEVNIAIMRAFVKLRQMLESAQSQVCCRYQKTERA